MAYKEIINPSPEKEYAIAWSTSVSITTSSLIVVAFSFAKKSINKWNDCHVPINSVRLSSKLMIIKWVACILKHHEQYSLPFPVTEVIKEFTIITHNVLLNNFMDVMIIETIKKWN